MKLKIYFGSMNFETKYNHFFIKDQPELRIEKALKKMIEDTGVIPRMGEDISLDAEDEKYFVKAHWEEYMDSGLRISRVSYHNDMDGELCVTLATLLYDDYEDKHCHRYMPPK